MLKKFSAGMLLFALIMPLSIQASPAQARKPPAPATAERDARIRDHIRSALREMREARRELQTADHDFGGHRMEAIEATNNLIKIFCWICRFYHWDCLYCDGN